jgi:hypothetical protein
LDTTSQPGFGERLSVTTECAFYCFLVAGLWAIFRMPLSEANSTIEKLAILAPTFIATGVFAILGAATPFLIPSDRPTFPTNITAPILWNLISVLSIGLINTQESTTTTVPFVLRHIIEWGRPINFLGVGALQVLFLSLLVKIRRAR